MPDSAWPLEIVRAQARRDGERGESDDERVRDPALNVDQPVGQSHYQSPPEPSSDDVRAPWKSRVWYGGQPMTVASAIVAETERSITPGNDDDELSHGQDRDDGTLDK